MIRTILSIAGKPGLYRLVNQGRNMLIVESLDNGKRLPAYSRDKIMSLGDIAMYTYEEDVPLAEIFERLYAKTEGKPVDLKNFKDNAALREYFGEVLENFDRERVHDSDIKKFFQWFNILVNAGITEFKAKEENSDEKTSEEADS